MSFCSQFTSQYYFGSYCAPYFTCISSILPCYSLRVTSYTPHIRFDHFTISDILVMMQSSLLFELTPAEEVMTRFTDTETYIEADEGMLEIQILYISNICGFKQNNLIS